MKRMINYPSICLLVCLLTSFLFSSCTMMDEDRSDCEEGLNVSFRYDYNMHGDLFNDQVGAITLYVLDTNNKVVRVETAENDVSNAPLAVPGYRMHIEGLSPGKYRLVALAMQAGEAKRRERQGAKFIIPHLQIGDSLDKLQIELEHSKDPRSLSLGEHDEKDLLVHTVENGGMALDTLWHTLEVQDCEVRFMKPTYATVPLIRDTKLINLTIRQTEDATDLKDTDYDVFITADNGHLNEKNDVVPEEPLLYTPFAQWTIDEASSAVTTPDEGEIVHANSLHYDFSVSRLVVYPKEESKHAAKLYIVNKKDNKRLVAVLNLPEFLSYGREAYARRYSSQEYLDRENQYDIDLLIAGNRLRAITIRIGILRWQKRIQIEDI